MAEPGHRDSWAAPKRGWPVFCSTCGAILTVHEDGPACACTEGDRRTGAK